LTAGILTNWQECGRSVSFMARVITLARRIEPDWQLETLRMTLVCFSALALIAAGRVLPF